jgi:hypothetical protein
MRRQEEYRCEAVSVDAFVQHLATSYVRCGYVFYVTGEVPKKKTGRDVDRKMIAKYGITASKFTRSRRKRAGLPNAHYLRHGRFWVLLVTQGHQHFFKEEGLAVRDARECPIKYEDYAVGFYSGKPSIRIEEKAYLNLKGHFDDYAMKLSAETLASWFYNLPFRPYGAIVKQVRSIVKSVNEARKAAGLELVPNTAVRWYRHPIPIFEPGSAEGPDALGGVVGR